MPRLTDVQREKLKEILADDRMMGMFGDGLKMDYIMEGTTIVGLNHMSDEELVEEYEQYNDDDDEFLVELRAELAVENLLKETV